MSKDDDVKRCDAFVNDILDSAKKHKIHPDSMFHLFGLIGRMNVEAQVDEGAKHPQAMLSVVGGFMKGLGMQTVSVSGDDENASVH
jgi:hypothetical protein